MILPNNMIIYQGSNKKQYHVYDKHDNKRIIFFGLMMVKIYKLNIDYLQLQELV